jgi:peptidoglycan hydrolase CwlO-like protein
MSSSEILGAVVGALGSIGAVAVTFTTLKNSFKKELQKEIADSIASARDIADADIRAFNLRIDSLSKEIASLENKIDKDIDHVKNIYNGEIRSLADKIENLREEVRHQHSQLVSLLTKLVTEK